MGKQKARLSVDSRREMTSISDMPLLVLGETSRESYTDGVLHKKPTITSSTTTKLATSGNQGTADIPTGAFNSDKLAGRIIQNGQTIQLRQQLGTITLDANTLTNDPQQALAKLSDQQPRRRRNMAHHEECLLRRRTLLEERR